MRRSLIKDDHDCIIGEVFTCIEVGQEKPYRAYLKYRAKTICYKYSTLKGAYRKYKELVGYVHTEYTAVSISKYY